MTTALNDQAAADVVAALGILPEDSWEIDDDRCDCTFQRIGMWTSPYLNTTLQVRACCIWKELYKLFPNFVREVPAFLDYNNGDQWKPEAMEWQAETDMPKSLWYRQLARQTGRSVADIRAEYRGRDDERPKGVVRPVLTVEPDASPTEILYEMIMGLADEVSALRAKMEGFEGK